MNKIKELRMTAIILLLGVFLLSGCFFSSKYEITFKTNGGSEVKNVTVKSGNKLEMPETPTKEGYVFEGWYLNGKEYNFEDTVEEDITLVAKWRKIEVDADDEENGNDNANEELTTKSTTTKRVATTKKTTASGTTKAKTTTTTTTKVTTTTTKVVEENNKPSVPEEPVTTNPIEPTNPVEPTEPIEPTIPDVSEEPTEPVDPITPDETEKKELKMNITITEEEIKVSTLIENKNSILLDNIALEFENKDNINLYEETKKQYNMVIDLDSEEVNVESNLLDDDLNNLLESDIATWEIYDQIGTIFIPTIDNTKLSLTSESEIKTITISVDESNYVITFNSEEEKWLIDYPSVMVTSEEKNMYYANLQNALSAAKTNDKITLLKDLEIEDMVVIDKAIIIDGNDFKITNSYEYLFNIQGIDDEENSIMLMNMDVEVNGLVLIEEVKLDKIILDNIKGTYTNKIMENQSEMDVQENNLDLIILEETL